MIDSATDPEDFETGDGIEIAADDFVVLSFCASAEDHGQRIDKVLAGRFPAFSRSRLKALILDGALLIDDALCDDPSAGLKAGMIVALAVPPLQDAAPAAEDIPLSIVYEDEYLLVIDKPAGLVVHPGAGNARGTLVNALLHHCGDTLSGIGGVRRPGIVHRLDKDTSGLMVVAKSDFAHHGLSAQLADRTLGRRYKALVWGVPDLLRGRIDQPIGRHPTNRLKMAVNSKTGREAATNYQRAAVFGTAASLQICRLETGRTHQIRVHMAHIRHPLVGDPLYGMQKNGAEAALRRDGVPPARAAAILSFPRQALHAWELSFVHPHSGAEMMFEAPLPADFQNLINLFESID